MKQMEALLAEAGKREYWSGVPAQYIPHTGKAGSPAVEDFWRWYIAEFHGEAEMARQRALSPAPVPYRGGALVYEGPSPAVEVAEEHGMVIVASRSEPVQFSPAVASSLVQQIGNWREVAELL